MESGEDGGGLDIAVNDTLLVGELDGVADADERFEPLAGGKPPPEEAASISPEMSVKFAGVTIECKYNPW